MNPKAVLTLDLTGERPLVCIDGVPVQGVTSADLEVRPDRLPTLVLHVVCFTLTGADLPRIPDFGGATANKGERP
jgi:hypothetical protein